MAVSYKKLLKLMIDRDLKKKDLRELTDLSTASIAKLTNNRHVNTEVLERICLALECDIGDIMEIIIDKK